METDTDSIQRNVFLYTQKKTKTTTTKQNQSDHSVKDQSSIVQAIVGPTATETKERRREKKNAAQHLATNGKCLFASDLVRQFVDRG